MEEGEKKLKFNKIMKHDSSANKLLTITEPKKPSKNETAKAEPNASRAVVTQTDDADLSLT